jgi:hypothetical protein
MMATGCDQVNPFLVEDLAADGDRRLRAAALEVLDIHDESGARRWVWEGLTDPEAHVRMRLVRHLHRIDPGQCSDLFNTALTIRIRRSSNLPGARVRVVASVCLPGRTDAIFVQHRRQALPTICTDRQ